jgi:hypothetical protein
MCPPCIGHLSSDLDPTGPLLLLALGTSAVLASRLALGSRMQRVRFYSSGTLCSALRSRPLSRTPESPAGPYLVTRGLAARATDPFPAHKRTQPAQMRHPPLEPLSPTSGRARPAKRCPGRTSLRGPPARFRRSARACCARPARERTPSRYSREDAAWGVRPSQAILCSREDAVLEHEVLEQAKQALRSIAWLARGQLQGPRPRASLRS